MNIRTLFKPAVYIPASYLVLILYIADYIRVYQELFPTVVALSNSIVFYFLVWLVVLTSAQLAWLLLSRLFFRHLNTAERELVVDLYERKVLPVCIFAAAMRAATLSPITVIALGAVVMRLLHTVAQERVATLVTLTESRRTQLVLLARLVLFLKFSLVYSVSTLTIQYFFAHGVSMQDCFAYDVACIMNAQHICSILYLTIRLFCEQMYGEHQFISTLACLEFAHHFCLSILVVCYTMGQFMLDRRPLYLIPVTVISIESLFRRVVRLWMYINLTRMMRSLSKVTEEDLQQEQRCIICYEDMSVTAACKRLPCGHCYHESCLLKWFRENDKCPYCRANLFKTLATQNAQAQVPAAAAAAAAAVVPAIQSNPRPPPTHSHLQQPQVDTAAAAEATAANAEQPVQQHSVQELCNTATATSSTALPAAVSAKPLHPQTATRANEPAAAAETQTVHVVLPCRFPTQEIEAVLQDVHLTAAQKDEARLKLYRDYTNHVESVTQHLRSLLRQLED